MKVKFNHLSTNKEVIESVEMAVLKPHWEQSACFNLAY